MKQITQAVIFAGGLGTRLRPLTLQTPKPMITIHGKPFLEYILHVLKQNNITDVLILTGYLSENIVTYFKDGRKFGLSISYSHSPIEDLTGTRLRKAKEYISEEFLLLYSDNYWPLELNTLYTEYKKRNVDVLVTVYSNKDNYTQNNMFLDENGFIQRYDKKKSGKNVNCVDIGFFILKKSVLNLLPSNNCSFEETVIPRLIKKRQLAGFMTHHRYYGLSNINRIQEIENFFTPKKVVFLDRDGVINKKVGKAQYITKWKDFKFLPKAKDALKLLQKKDYVIFIVSNQPGIARKMLTEKKLNLIHRNFLKEVKKIGVNIQEIFVCKHGWEDNCFCRKPNPGLFFQAANKYYIDLYKAYCIGDDQRDIIAGQKAGCKTFLVTEKENLYSIVTKYL